MRPARHHLLPDLPPVVDEVAEAVVVVVDVGVRRAMMSHREQFQDVADDPGRLADDDYAENLTPAGLPWRRPDPSPCLSKRRVDCWDRSGQPLEVRDPDPDQPHAEA